MKIVLVCATGMSTSMLLEKMEQFMLEEDTIFACGRNDVVKHLATADCFLIAPQIRYLYEVICKQCKEVCVAASLIDLKSYGRLDGKQIMEQAREACELTHVMKASRNK